MCPYHTVPSDTALPPVLISAARGDARVPLWGPLKWAAKLRAAQELPPQPGWLARVRDTIIQSAADPGAADMGDRKTLKPCVESGYRRETAKRQPRGVVLVCVSDGGGHFGDERDFYADAARDYAFLISSMPPPK